MEKKNIARNNDPKESLRGQQNVLLTRCCGKRRKTVQRGDRTSSVGQKFLHRGIKKCGGGPRKDGHYNHAEETHSPNNIKKMQRSKKRKTRERASKTVTTERDTEPTRETPGEARQRKTPRPRQKGGFSGGEGEARTAEAGTKGGPKNARGNYPLRHLTRGGKKEKGSKR